MTQKYCCHQPWLIISSLLTSALIFSLFLTLSSPSPFLFSPLPSYLILSSPFLLSPSTLLSSPPSRPDLTLKLTQMRERWQQIVSVAQQRSSLVQERLGQWRFYTRGVRRLGGLLRDVETLFPSAAQALCTLQQLPCSLEDLGVRTSFKYN